jgi:hypothetical protein
MLQNATPIDALSPSQEKAIAALLMGKPVTDAASAAGVDRTTVHRWLREDIGFQVAFNRSRRELREAMINKLMALAEKATDAVERSITEGDGKTALSLLKGLGLLSGEPPKIGSDDPQDLADDAAHKELYRRLMRQLEG